MRCHPRPGGRQHRLSLPPHAPFAAPIAAVISATIAASLAMCVALPASAARKKRAEPPPKPWPAPKKLPIERFTLDNGLRVVVQPDSSAPQVAIGLMVDVGARDEVNGKSGLAHFFEHMMFQGSSKVGKMEHFTALEAVGAQLNANTSTDRTYYYEVVPKGAVELALWLETDRFSSLKISPENVENQRQTVMEERRQRYGNRPYALSRMKLREMAFTTWDLNHSTIGSMADLKAAPIEAFEAFWQYWYTPNNVVLALVGNITVDEAKDVLSRTLGKLERRAEVQKKKFAEPEPKSHVYGVFAEPLGKMPAFHLAYRVPAKPHPDAYAIEVLSEVLDGGDAARLRKKLAKDTGLATRHFAGIYGHRDVDLFHVFVELSEGGLKPLGKAKEIVRAAFYDIARDGVSDEELRRAKVSFEAGYVFGIESFATRAEALCRHELYYGDANGFNEALGKYRAVTADDLVRVARKYFVFDREVELDVLPKGLAAPADGGSKPKDVLKAEQKLAKTLEKRRKAEEKRLRREEARRKKAEAKAAKIAARKAAKEAKRAAREEAKRKKAEAKAAKIAAKKAAAEAKRAKAEAKKQAAADAKKAVADATKAAKETAAEEKQRAKLPTPDDAPAPAPKAAPNESADEAPDDAPPEDEAPAAKKEK